MKQLSFDYLESQLASRLEGIRGVPLAILDIDSTIMDTSPRNMKILKELSDEIVEIRDVVNEIHESDIGWNVVGFLKQRVNLSGELERKARTFWAERFFSSEYVVLDTPYPGVKRLVEWLIERGISIIYLTGRDEPNMSEGTIRSFFRHGLPSGGETRFIFKPDFDEPDLDFKLRAMQEINESGKTVLAIENEPGNANIIKRSCPDALVLLINTITSPSPDVPDEGIIGFDLYPAPW